MKLIKNILCSVSLFLAFIFIFSAGHASAQAVNLVPNPSLETASGSAPLNWLTGKWGTNTTTFTYLTTGHTGSRSVKVQMTKYTSGDAKWYFTPQTVTPGTVYTVSDYYESNIVSHFMLQFQLASGSYQYTELATAPASSTAWRQYTGTVTAPANAVNMTIFHLISAVGWLTTDDYSVTTTTPPTTGSIKVTKTAVNGNGTFNFTGSTGISAFSITTASGTGSYTVSNLTPGTYSITESTLSTGWAQTSTTCSSVTVTAGNTATCTVTNTYTAPPTTGSIKVTKAAVNGNGTFNFTGSTGISAFSITTTSGTGSNTISGLAPGTYTITEGNLGTGWAQTSTTCSSVVVTAGNTATCGVTNTYTAPPTTGSIKVTKTAVNGNGTFNFTGSTGISAFSITTTSGTGSNTITGLTPGTYTITEGTLGTGWAQTSTTCSSVTVTAGNTATCTVTNTYTAPPTTGSITVTKTAVNGNGTFNFTGSTGISAFSITTTSGTGSNTITGLTPGTYTITEGTLGTGWAQTSTTCSSVVVTAGNTATCTVTNTYTAPPTTGSIKVTKTAVNGNGTFNFTGSTGISAFSITTASGTGSNTISGLTPGTYTITEGTLATGWAKTADTCSSVVVTAGNTATCVVTNTYTAPPTTGSITVTKTAVNGNGTFNFTGSTGISAFSITTTSGTGSNTISGLTPGTYTITEGTLGTGWAQTSTTCSSVVVTAGNTATCTVTNTYTAPPTTGSIKVTKTAVNGNGTFNFTGSTGISAFSITTASGTGSNTINNLTPGTYTITEGTLGTGWAQTSTTCSSVTVTAGNTATCTVTNTYTASGNNVVPNPSVETVSGSNPASWTTESWGNNTTTFAYLTNSGHTGTHSVKVTTTKYTDGDSKWYFNPITVTPGDDYIFTDWYQSNITSRIVVYFVYQDGTEYYDEMRTAPVASTWTQYSDMITVPANAKTMTVFHMISVVGWLQTDDFSLIKTAAVGFDKARVSFTFDDGWETNTTTMLPIVKSDNFKVTYYFATTYLEATNQTCTDPGSCGPAAVRAILADGHEIGAHSVTHPDLTTLSPADLTYEVTHCKQYLEGIVGTGNVKSFATPFGAYNNTVLAALQTAGYQSHRPTDEGYNMKNNFDPWRLKVVNMTKTTTLAEYKSWIDQAIKDKTWLIVVYHVINPDPLSQLDDYDTPYNDFVQQMAYVKSTGVTVEPITQTIADITPQLGQ